MAGDQGTKAPFRQVGLKTRAFGETPYVAIFRCGLTQLVGVQLAPAD
jgi:hypothetical protein